MYYAGFEIAIIQSYHFGWNGFQCTKLVLVNALLGYDTHMLPMTHVPRMVLKKYCK
jgi:hypothetical protein